MYAASFMRDCMVYLQRCICPPSDSKSEVRIPANVVESWDSLWTVRSVLLLADYRRSTAFLHVALEYLDQFTN
jgi:hypothetical protein